MKIAILHDDFPPDHSGGAGAVAFDVARGYQRAGHEVLVIAATQDRARAGCASYEGLIVERIFSQYPAGLRGYYRLYNPQTVSRVRKLLSEFEPEIAHAHGVHTHLSYYSLIVAKRLGAKVYLTAHDATHFYHRKFTEFIDFSSTAIPTSFDYRARLWPQIKELKLRYNPLKNLLTRRMLARIDGVIAVSYALKSALEQNGIRVRAVVHNGIDTSAWEATPLLEHMVLYVGDMSDAKGGGATLRAMEEVVQKLPEARLMIAGRIARPLPQYATALGWRSGAELKAAYAAARVVLQPSLCLETFGLTALEGMAAGRPVIGTCFGGVPEVVKDGETGYIINPLDREMYAARLIELLSNGPLAQRMGAAGRARAEREFSLEKQIEAYLSLFGKAV